MGHHHTNSMSMRVGGWVKRLLFNTNNFATSAASAEVCALLGAILVFYFISAVRHRYPMQCRCGICGSDVFLCEFADLFILLQLRCFITNGLPALLFTAECVTTSYSRCLTACLPLLIQPSSWCAWESVALQVLNFVLFLANFRRHINLQLTVNTGLKWLFAQN